jgi:hypothetical protein
MAMEISRKSAGGVSMAFHYSFADGDRLEGMQRVGRWLRGMLSPEIAEGEYIKFFQSVGGDVEGKAG